MLPRLRFINASRPRVTRCKVQIDVLSMIDRDDHAPRLCRMLDQLVGVSNLVQGDNFGNIASLPPCLKRGIDVVSRFDLRLGWHIVATDEEESGVHKYKLPDRSFWH